jgi:hypothetical protein
MMDQLGQQSATMATARYIFAGFGSRSNGLGFGGPPSPGFSAVAKQKNTTQQSFPQPQVLGRAAGI